MFETCTARFPNARFFMTNLLTLIFSLSISVIYFVWTLYTYIGGSLDLNLPLAVVDLPLVQVCWWRPSRSPLQFSSPWCSYLLVVSVCVVIRLTSSISIRFSSFSSSWNELGLAKRDTSLSSLSKLVLSNRLAATFVLFETTSSDPEVLISAVTVDDVDIAAGDAAIFGCLLGHGTSLCEIGILGARGVVNLVTSPLWVVRQLAWSAALPSTLLRALPVNRLSALCLSILWLAFNVFGFRFGLGIIFPHFFRAIKTSPVLFISNESTSETA